MGDASGTGRNEWMELKNISSESIALFGWSLLDAAGKIKINFADHETFGAGGLLILARASNTLSFAAQTHYSGNLINSGNALAILDPACAVSDAALAAHGWMGGNNATKQTLERNTDGIEWHTSVSPGGTPGAENSIPAVSPSLASSTPASAATSTKMFDVTIAVAGDGAGVITVSPGGTRCTVTCKVSYVSGTPIVLSPAPEENTTFNGWSDPCLGQTTCSFAVTGPMFLVATFKTSLAPPSLPVPATPTAVEVSTSTLPAGHLLIAAVQIAGASSTNDIIKIYNPTSDALDISGWKLHKKSQTGTEASLRTFPANSTIAAHDYFIWANSQGGFAAAIGANIFSTETLAADSMSKELHTLRIPQRINFLRGD